MGKKGGRNGGEKKGDEGAAKARAFVLKVAMHCRCNGCTDKIRAGVKDLTLHHGIEALDQSALESKGELKLVATGDPEKLRRRLHKATGKNVDLILPKADEDTTKAADKDAATAAAVQALLRNSLQPVQYGQGAWANQLLPGSSAGWNPHQGSYGYGAADAAQAYPWAAQQPEAYASYHSAYPAVAGAWGAYAYPPPQGHGAYGGGWHAHGRY